MSPQLVPGKVPAGTGAPSAAVTPLANDSPAGLSSNEARQRLEKVGPNSVPDVEVNPWSRAITQLWSPVPWMLEAAIVLELVLGKYVESGIIAILLIANAALGFFQEGQAQGTLAALKKRLALTASVRRDGAWKSVPAVDLVSGDIVKLSLGGVVAADVKLLEGNVLLDQSMLTGETVGAEAGPGFQAFAGAMVRRGEAVSQVMATGSRTKFGRTAELVRTAHVVSSQQTAVFRVVRNLAVFNGCLTVLMAVYAHFHSLPESEMIPLILTAVLASIPVALPATFTLASALGARVLASQGVLPTRLSAMDEAGSMAVLCVDKTGTLTRNQLSVTSVHSFPGFDESHVLMMASLASSDGGQDPVDLAIKAASAKKALDNPPKLLHFKPFDPATKMSEAMVTTPDLRTVRIVKGAFTVVAAIGSPSPTATAEVAKLEGRGFRVLAVAEGSSEPLQLMGLIALSDPAREDSPLLVSQLKALGVRLVMVTGDAGTTAEVVAREVGIEGKVCPAGAIPKDVRPDSFAVFAGILPEDKFNLVKAFQRAGNIVGMCGDGVNDAPALRQAQMGIAVSTANDVAKSAAGMVLTAPGLIGVVAAVKEGRITFQRIQTYTLNSVTSKIVKMFLLVAGLLMTDHAVLTPMLMIISMLEGDLPGMSLTTDNVLPSQQPNRWRIGNLTLAGIFMGMSELVFCVSVLAVGHYGLKMGIATLQTLAFITLVCGNQAMTYAVRARGRIWSVPYPSRWLILSSVVDLGSALTLAGGGWFMMPLPLGLMGIVLFGSIGFVFLVDLVKVSVFRRLEIS